MNTSPGPNFSWNPTSATPTWDDPRSTLSPADVIKDIRAENPNGYEAHGRLADLRQNFQNAVMDRVHWETDAIEDYNFYMGDQWPQSARTWLHDGGRPCLTLNKIKPLINTVLGYQSQNRYEPDFLPRTADDLPLAEIRRAVTKWIFDYNGYSSTETRIFRDAVLGGVGYIYAGFERTHFHPDGRIVLKRVSPFDVYIDPESHEADFSDAEYVFVASWKTKGALAGAFPEFRDDIYRFNDEQDYDEMPQTRGGGGFNAKPLNVWLSSDRRKVRVVTAWYKVWREAEFVADPSDPSGIQLMMVPEGVKVPAASVVMTQGVAEIRCATFIQNVLLEDLPSPYDHGRFPIIPLGAYYCAEGDAPQGLVRDLKDPQMELNKRRSQLLHILNTTAFNGLMIEEGSMTEGQKERYAQFGSKPGSIVEVVQSALSGGKVHEIQPKPMPDSVARLEDAFANDLKVISGINEEMMGTDTPANASGRAIEMRQRSSVTQIALLFDNLREFKRQLCLVLWGEGEKRGLVQQFLTQPMTLRVSDNAAQPEFANINEPVVGDAAEAGGPVVKILNDVTVGDFDIVVTDSPSSPSKRYSDFLALMELMKTPVGAVLAQTVPDIFLELSDVPNKQMIQQRLQAAMQQQQQAAQAQQGMGNEAPLGSMPNQKQSGQMRKPQGSQSNAPNPADPGVLMNQLLNQ